jgi:malate dehydrogenase (oxaloacetate-decarboxylating)(NADP+)
MHWRLPEKRSARCAWSLMAAGAAGIACAAHYIRLGVKRENILMCDTKGVIYKGRKDGMNAYKECFAQETDLRTVAEAMVCADVFVSCSVKGAVTADMVRSMAKNPIGFAMANPDPEITFEEAKASRSDVIMATRRSDYPNQVNYVLGFPFIFRGALDVRATAINEEMKLAATHALAALAKEDVPDSVCHANGVERLQFGREYLIPKPFEPRVLLWEAAAVARAAMETGAAREPINLELHREQLERRFGRAHEVARMMAHKGRVLRGKWFFRKEITKKSCAPAIPWWKKRLPRRSCWGMRKSSIGKRRISGWFGRGADRRACEFHSARTLHGGTFPAAAAARCDTHRGAFSDPESQLFRLHDAVSGRCGCSGVRGEPAFPGYDPAGSGNRARAGRVAQSVWLLRHDHQQGRSVLPRGYQREYRSHGGRLGRDCVVHGAARRFDIEPRVAMLSFSSFGSTRHPHTENVRRAVELLHRADPALVVDGEVMADVAVSAELLEEQYPYIVR